MSSVPIQPRKVAFDVSSVPRHWNGGDPVLTRFLTPSQYISRRESASLSSQCVTSRIR